MEITLKEKKPIVKNSTPPIFVSMNVKKQHNKPMTTEFNNNGSLL